MEGAEPHGLGAVADEGLDAFAHFAGGFVGEGDAEDALGRDAELHESGDAIGDDAGLSGARTGEDEEGSAGVGHGFGLFWIEYGKVQ